MVCRTGMRFSTTVFQWCCFELWVRTSEPSMDRTKSSQQEMVLYGKGQSQALATASNSHHIPLGSLRSQHHWHSYKPTPLHPPPGHPFPSHGDAVAGPPPACSTDPPLPSHTAGWHRRETTTTSRAERTGAN